MPGVRARLHAARYLRYLPKTRELTGLRLLTLHNLAYVQRLMAACATRSTPGTLAEAAAAVRAGAAPWELAAPA